jgi:hypothetical protein
MVSTERPWKGKPSCTMLIQGTMCAFLKIIKDYDVSPDSRAFMINGTRGHNVLEDAGCDDEFSEIELKFTAGDISGIADNIETEKGIIILSDNKISGSFKIAKALGIKVIDVPTGEFFKSGKRIGEEKTRKVMKRDESYIDVYDWTLQTNFYRIEYEKLTGKKINEIRIQAIVRDGGLYIARNRGVVRNVYYFKIPIVPDNEIKEYFKIKKEALEKALKQGYWNEICSAKENWDGIKCARYCEVAEHCKFGKYLKQEKETEDMVIKGLSDVRRLPRLGKIRLGIKKVSEKSGKEYPAEVNYFILDPQVPSEQESKNLIESFHGLYGVQPKQIKIMFPVADPQIFFPQFYKRYGSSTSLKCKGDGEAASCATDEFAKGLKVIRKNELGNPEVECKGKDCPYYKSKECTEVATLQVLLPELPGAGVWQITTGSFNSIVNLNSCIDYIRAVAGRVHMIPLMLERHEQEITYEGKKSKHYILHINMDFKLSELQKLALIDPTKALLELPEPETSLEDLEKLPDQVKEAEIVDKETGEVIEDNKPVSEEEKRKVIEECKKQRIEIRQWVFDMNGKDKDKSKKSLNAFTDNHDLQEIFGNMLDELHAKVEISYKAWKQQQSDNNPDNW